MTKILPYNLEAERAVLGAILLDDKAILLITDKLAAEDFYLGQHKILFQRMLKMSERRKPIDLVTLLHELRDTEIKATEISDLTDGLPRAINIEHYAGLIREASVLRQTIKIANDCITRAYDATEESQVLLLDTQKALFEIGHHEETSELEPASEIAVRVHNQIQKRSEQKGVITGLATGFADLDRMTGGLQQSDMIVLAARPGIGKTSLALNIASVQKGLTAIFSLEMSKSQLMQRLLCSEAQVSSHRVKTGYLGREDWVKINEATARVYEMPIWIDDSSSISMAGIRAKSRRLQLEKGLSMVIIDYIQLMGGTRRENRNQEVSEISRQVKGLAKELDVPILAISQLNRAMEINARRPQLSDLRESGSIEQDADIVMFLYKQKEGAEADASPIETVDLIVAKHRSGPTGLIQLMWAKELTRFWSVARSEAA